MSSLLADRLDIADAGLRVAYALHDALADAGLALRLAYSQRAVIASLRAAGDGGPVWIIGRQARIGASDVWVDRPTGEARVDAVLAAAAAACRREGVAWEIVRSHREGALRLRRPGRYHELQLVHVTPAHPLRVANLVPPA